MPQKLNIRNISQIRSSNPLLAEALESIAEQVGHVADQTTATLHTTTQAPPPPEALNVTASGGVFDFAITHTAPVQRGINYFVEYSQSPSFAQASTIDLGQSRNHRVFLGNQTLYFRTRAGYPTSPPSEPTYFIAGSGSPAQPTAVVGGGAIAGPTPQPSQGAGTSQGANGGDGGFGNNPVRQPVTSGTPQIPQA